MHDCVVKKSAQIPDCVHLEIMQATKAKTS